MKSTMIFFLMLCFMNLNSGAVAINADTSALELKLEHIDDIERLSVLAELVTLNQNNAPLKAITYGEEGLVLLKYFPNIETEFTLLFGLGRAHDVIDDYPTSKKYIEKSLALAKKSGHIAYQAKANMNLGMNAFHYKEFEQAENLLLIAKDLYSQVEDYKGKVAVLLNLSLIYNEADSNKIKPLKMLLEANELARSIDYTIGVAFTANNIAGLYKELGDLDKAIEYTLLALKLKQQLNHKESLGNSYNQLGEIYFSQGDPQTALNYHLLALSLFEEIGDKELRGSTYTLIGNIHLDQGRMEAAFEAFKHGQYFLEPLKHFPKLIHSQLSLSRAYRQNKQYDLALEAVEKSQKWADKTKNNEQQADINFEKALILKSLMRLPEALFWVKLSHTMYTNDKLLPKQVESLQLIASLQYALADYQSAFSTQNELIAFNEQLAKSNNQDKVALLTIGFETEQKEQAIHLLTLEKEQQATALKQEQHIRYLWAVIITFGLSFIFVAILFFYKSQMERRKYTLEMEKHSAESQANLKTQLLADMSHEIKTPLHGVSGIAQLLLGSSLTADQRQKVEQILLSSDHLTQMVEKVLSYSKIDYKGIEIHEQWFDLNEFSKQIALLMRPLAEAKGLTLSIKNENTHSFWAYGDDGLLRQVIINLLSNSIKFTEQGTVTLLMSINESQKLIIEVLDTGVGIAKIYLDKIGLPFSQADESIQIKYGGTGLGLSICQKILHYLGGKLTISSDVGSGTKVKCEIPFKLVVNNPYPMTKLTHDETFATQGKILLVEDLQLNQKIAVEMLAKDQHVVVIANSIADAEKKLTEQFFDVILMDIHLPDGNGLMFTKQLKARGLTTKIIGFTASSSLENIHKYLSAGMYSVLPKPLRLHTLRSQISEAMNTYNPLTRTVIATETKNGLDLDLNQLNEMKKTFSKGTLDSALLDFFILSEQFIQLLQQSNNQEIIKLKRDAHKLAGAAMNFGLNKLAYQLRRVEMEESIEALELISLIKSCLKQLKAQMADANI